jgi:cell division transport system ATP-binding protein
MLKHISKNLFFMTSSLPSPGRRRCVYGVFKDALKLKKLTYQLLGGEQQRVFIAYSLPNRPDMILADEPTGNLDPETSESFMKILHEIQESGRAVLMVTHNYSLVKKYPARTLKCEGEKLLEVEELSKEQVGEEEISL